MLTVKGVEYLFIEIDQVMPVAHNAPFKIIIIMFHKPVPQAVVFYDFKSQRFELFKGTDV